MNSIVCTLFEGHYHYGVAVLVNSLYRQGYRGEIYAGYRGGLPFWASSAKTNDNVQGNECNTMSVASDLQLHFIKLDTHYHLTNYKPDFILDLWKGIAKNADGMFYFDPDIVIAAPWHYFETWVSCGVALCEDINSPLSENHPRRVAWRNYFAKSKVTLTFKDSTYVNGGFIGVHQHDQSFLQTWQLIQETMAQAIGGLHRSALTGVKVTEQGPFTPFGKTDQDALNASIEAWEGNVSLIGKSGMAFTNSGGIALLPHALGKTKPWKSNYFKQALSGQKIRVVDKFFWENANGVIKPFSKNESFWKLTSIKFNLFVNRFYKK